MMIIVLQPLSCGMICKSWSDWSSHQNYLLSPPISPVKLPFLFPCLKEKSHKVDQLKHPPMEEWTNKIPCICSVGYCSAFRGRTFWHVCNMDEPWGHHTVWHSWATKAHMHMIPLTGGTQSNQNHRDRRWNSGFQGGAESCLVASELQTGQ